MINIRCIVFREANNDLRCYPTKMFKHFYFDSFTTIAIGTCLLLWNAFILN